jgi:hypothetical protein
MTSTSPPRTTPMRRRWRRHRYPDRFIDRRQELLMAVVFGLLGLGLTALVFLNAESLMCALGEWSPECSRMASMAAVP